MTIQQIFKDYSNYTKLAEDHYGYMMDEEDFTNAVKELIEYHVKAALLQVSQKENLIISKKKSQYGKYRKWQNVKEGEDVDLFSYQMKWEINKDLILNSYPSTLIK